MSEWRKYIDRIRKELGIPEEQWYEVLDKLTIRDELLIMLIYEIRQLRNDIRGIYGYKPVPYPIYVPTPAPAPTPTPAPAPSPAPSPTVKMPKIMYIADAPLIPLKDDKISVETGEDTTYTFKDETEVVTLTVYGTDVRISFAGATTDRTHIYPDGSLLIFTRAKNITRMWARAVTGTGEIYITEWVVENG